MGAFNFNKYSSSGVLECWSNDEWMDVLLFQHSNTPSLQYSKTETSKKIWSPLLYLLLGMTPLFIKLRFDTELHFLYDLAPL